MREPLSRRRFLARAGAAIVAGGAAPAWAATAKVGEPAPTFTGTSTNGSPVSLADHKGKVVVLEWTNHDCPYVRKHYETGNMQALQREATAQGIVWLTLISSAKGEQGCVTPAKADELTTTRKAAPTAVLLDATGRGRAAVRRHQHAPHVRGGQDGPAGLRGRHRRPADQPARRRAGGQQLRARGPGGGSGRPAGEDAGHARLRLHGQVLVATKRQS